MTRAQVDTGLQTRHTPNPYLVNWLSAGIGRGSFFGKADRTLTGPVISKMKNGDLPISFEHACRMEAATISHKSPLDASLLCSYEKDAALVRTIRANAVKSL